MLKLTDLVGDYERELTELELVPYCNSSTATKLAIVRAALDHWPTKGRQMKKFLIVAALLACAGSAQAFCTMAGCTPPKGCGSGWYDDLWIKLGATPCTAAQIAQQAEWDKQAADREAQAKRDKLDADFHAIELSCRVSSITYFQYTGCVELMVEAYKSNH